MAAVSWVYGDSSFYVNISTPTSITASGATTTITLPSVSLRGGSTTPSSTKKWYAIGGYYSGSTFVENNYDAEIERSDGGQVYFGLTCRTTTKVTENTYSTATWVSTPTVNTSKIFGSFNRNSKTESLKIALNANYGGWYGDGTHGYTVPNASKVTLATINVTLNAPPIVSYDSPIYNNPQYSGLGAYSVNVIEAEAQYSGYVSSMTLTVGTDSVTQTYASTKVTNQTLSVIPTVAGTYTPTLTVTDTRGQTTTTTFPQITVNPYNSPSLDFDVVRTNSIGVRDDEGAYGLVTANISFTDAVANMTEPTVQINGTTTSNVTWYSAYNASTGVSSAISDWSTVLSGDTIYGLINGSFSQTDSYQITITLEDSLGGESSAISQTLSTAFYTIDFQAGGKEITFGGPANDDLTNYPDGLFKCNMDTLFNDMTSQEVDEFVDDLDISGAIEDWKDILTPQQIGSVTYYTTGQANTWTKVANFTIPKRGLYRLYCGWSNSAVLGIAYSSTSVTSINASYILTENSTGSSCMALVWLDAGTYSLWTKCTTASKSNSFIITKVIDLY